MFFSEVTPEIVDTWDTSESVEPEIGVILKFWLLDKLIINFWVNGDNPFKIVNVTVSAGGVLFELNKDWNKEILAADEPDVALMPAWAVVSVWESLLLCPLTPKTEGMLI